ncbi:MAG TPA: LPS export ABC transporter permease LptF [Xanthobacteraceae bacterium]|nr:LPS export ABC transporter permease LptF [Xanthobacteraceae bacterium]
MGSIGRYIFRTTMVAFLITLVTLTVVIWFTQAMRDFDLITSERQTLFVFIGITGMIVPLLVMIIAPIALMVSSGHVLSRLSADSEIIVMNAAGVSPWRLLRPFLAAAILVSLLLAVIAAYISPRALRELRDWSSQVRADILTNIVQPGRFTSIGGNLTFHIADRRPNGLLVGIFVDDRRDPNEQATYLAEQGEIVKNPQGTFLVLEHGSIQRLQAGHMDPRILSFDRYPFDLSKFTSGPQNVVYTVREKYIWELMWPQPDDTLYAQQPDQYRSELYDRLATPLYPLAFAILTYMFLGPPQTTRQSRTLAMLGLIGSATALRLIGFASVIVGVRVPSVLAVQFIALAGAIIVGLVQISRGKTIEHGALATRIVNAITERVARATVS